MERLVMLYVGFLCLGLLCCEVKGNGAGHCPDVPNKNETTFVIGERCYHIKHEQTLLASWKMAQADCKSRGGHLFVIDSQYTQDAIHSKLEELSSLSDLWMGLELKDGAWQWVNGKSLSYENWSTQQADGNCAVFKLGESGLWTRRPCNDEMWFLGYVCQHDADSANGAVTNKCSFFGLLTMMISTLLTLVLSWSN